LPLLDEALMSNLQGHRDKARIILAGGVLDEAVLHEPRQRLLNCKVYLHFKSIVQVVLAELIELVLHSAPL
jgi:hypothetical protein